MNGKIIARIHLALAMILVGSSVTAGKIMARELPVFLASSLRFILALAFLFPIVRMREGGLPRLSKKSLGIIAAQALFGAFLFTVFLLYGLRYTTSSSAGVIASATPAVIGLIAWAFMRERPRAAETAGILAAVAGVMLVNLGSGMGTDAGGAAASSPLWGNFLVLCAVIFESLFLLLRKAVPEPLSPLSASTLVSFFGLLWFLPFGLYEAVGLDFSAVTLTGWLSVVYYAFFVTALAYIFWFSGVTRVSAAEAGVMTAVMPVSALLISALVLGEKLTAANIGGCAFALLGIGLLSLPRKERSGKLPEKRSGTRSESGPAAQSPLSPGESGAP